MANKVNLDTSERLDIMQVWGSKSSEPVIGSSNLGKSVKKNFEAFVVDDSGNVTISATAATMKDISSGVYIYDLMSILPSSTTADTHTTILRGNFTVNPDVSKSL